MKSTNGRDNSRGGSFYFGFIQNIYMEEIHVECINFLEDRAQLLELIL